MSQLFPLEDLKTFLHLFPRNKREKYTKIFLLFSHNKNEKNALSIFMPPFYLIIFPREQGGKCFVLFPNISHHISRGNTFLISTSFSQLFPVEKRGYASCECSRGVISQKLSLQWAFLVAGRSHVKLPQKGLFVRDK